MTGFILADIASTQLTADDREILRNPKVCGVVLFSRNYENPQQLRALTKNIYTLRPDFIVAVDQEGGRVQRFKEHFTDLPSMRHWGDLFKKNQAHAVASLTNVISQMARELKSVGVNFDLLPVLDLDRNLNSVIGERSFSEDPNVIIALAKVLIEALHQNDMPVVGKHFPGHGGVTADSHKTLPIDSRDFDAIQKADMKPFSELVHLLDAVMPAHVVFESVDTMPTTYSSFWLHDILRQQLGFSGVVISDDLTMAGAAQLGGYVDRAFAAVEAGCDILTVCNNQDGVVALLDEAALKQKANAKERIKQLLLKSKKGVFF